MKFIHDTVSLCNHCYRHIPGVIFERDDKIWLTKKCMNHGIMEEVVEVDTEFYYSLTKTNPSNFISIMLEVTNKCQLKCPHCYQLPDNSYVDGSIESVLGITNTFPDNFIPILAGAEASLYNDIISLSHTLEHKFKKVRMLTNGLRFADKDFSSKLLSGKNILPAVGLNHYTYQGKKVHDKQLRGIANIKEYGSLDGIGYTIEDINHLPNILEELDKIGRDNVDLVRIRMGASIGRSTGGRNYLSNTIKELKKLLGNDLVHTPLEDNLYHNMYNWKGMKLRLIQWPDVRSIDMEELNNGPWATFNEGPITNYIHQVILRDAFTNNKLKKLDIVPEYYRLSEKTADMYWKTNWTGPVDIKQLEYAITDPMRRPKRLL
jgi:MoaA/NifB/PqqE/SkfB family radical SAM enzyme